MPAEWEDHAATWLVWPTNRSTWPGTLLSKVESVYYRMIEALLRNEIVHLLVWDAELGEKIVARLKSSGSRTDRLRLHPVKTHDSWIRDYGPIFVKDTRGTFFTKWKFNAWGGKYKDLAKDNGAVDRLAALKKFKRMDVPMVLEGGSIETNGKGTLMTTEQCLLNSNRNPRLSRIQIESKLKKFLGAEKVLWLKNGIEGDDTDGHIDDLARFVNESTVLAAVEATTSDPNHSILEENYRILKKERTSSGKKIKILELPMPGCVRSKHGGERLPASYANYYVANGVVLLPVYSHANDIKAIRILRKAFPARRIVPIECTALVHGLGSVHCVTQQEPL